MTQLYLTPDTKPLTTVSPLNYFGGKSRAVKVLEQSILDHFGSLPNEVVSPFLGGGSFELYLTRRKINVYGYDLFFPLINFWRHWMNDTEAVVLKAREILYNNDRDTVNEKYLRKYNEYDDDRLLQAALAFINSRMSFFGFNFRTPTINDYIREENDIFLHKRVPQKRDGMFRKTSLIEQFYNPYFHVDQEDYRASLEKHKDTFAYIDPPYITKSAIYGDSRKYNEDFDHEEMFNLIKDRKNWILSYNDHPFILSLYKDFTIKRVNWWLSSRIKHKGESNEIVIFSKK